MTYALNIKCHDDNYCWDVNQQTHKSSVLVFLKFDFGNYQLPSIGELLGLWRVGTSAHHRY